MKKAPASFLFYKTQTLLEFWFFKCHLLDLGIFMTYTASITGKEVTFPMFSSKNDLWHTQLLDAHLAEMRRQAEQIDRQYANLPSRTPSVKHVLRPLQALLSCFKRKK